MSEPRRESAAVREPQNGFIWLIRAHDHIWNDKGWPVYLRVEICQQLQCLWIANLVVAPLTPKPPQGIDAPNCAHKQLKNQMVGEQLWYACECGQKFRIEAWDGKVSVLAPLDPRKDLAALDELAKEWRAREGFAGCEGEASVYPALAADLEQRLAEMRGAKR